MGLPLFHLIVSKIEGHVIQESVLLLKKIGPFCYHLYPR